MPISAATMGRTKPIYNAGWDEFLPWIHSIESNADILRNHIKPRHAAGVKYPQNPRNGRFDPSILSMGTLKNQFDAELDLLFNSQVPIPEPTFQGNMALLFTLPGRIVGTDANNVPTSEWTVVLQPLGGGTFVIVSTFSVAPEAFPD